jgi:hypothetical protein
MSAPILGSIKYLNSQEVENLLESFEGGLIEQVTHTTKEISGKKGGGNLSFPGTGIGVQGNIETVSEDTLEAVKKQTPVSRLTFMRNMLLAEGYIESMTLTELNLRESLKVGSIVEVRGTLSVSAFDELVSLASQYLGVAKAFGGLFGGNMKVDDTIEQQIRYLEMVTGKGTAVQVVTEKRDGRRDGFDFAAILTPEYLRVPRTELAGSAAILGRVKKLMAKNEVEYLYELFPGLTLIPRHEFRALIERLSKGPKGFTLQESDLRVRYPAVVLTPIAVYS